MSLFKKTSHLFACTALLFMLTGCGFTPLYKSQSGNKVVAHTRNISISNIPERNGQMLRNLLIDQMYGARQPVPSPRYRLEIKKLSVEQTSLGIRKDATATRSQMRVSVNLNLIDTYADAKDNIVLQRSLRTVNSFNILDSQYATRISRQNATELSLKAISDQVATALALYFKTARGTR